jgi:hypothetical protein
MWFFANGTVTGSDSSVAEGFADDDLAVPAAQFAGCPGSPDSAWQFNPQDLCADPVDTASGEFSDTFTDAALQAPGYPLSITRSYASAVTAAGPMGRGGACRGSPAHDRARCAASAASGGVVG